MDAIWCDKYSKPCSIQETLDSTQLDLFVRTMFGKDYLQKHNYLFKHKL